MPAPREILNDWLRARLGEAQRAWLDRALGEQPFDVARFHFTFGSAGRKLGSAPLEGPAPPSFEWLCDRAPASEIGRVLMLLRAASEPASELAGLVAEAYRTGDVAEKRAVMRSLALLPDPAQHVDLAVNACRTSVQPVFEGIACDNPYPAAHFPEAAFNQMVLKALFTGAPAARILGLATRIGPELVRMVEAYASERRAAGRPVPPDVELVLNSRGGP